MQVKELKETGILVQPVESKERTKFIALAPAYKVPESMAKHANLKNVKYIHVFGLNITNMLVTIRETGTKIKLELLEPVLDAKIQDNPTKLKRERALASAKATPLKSLIGHSFQKGNTILYCIGQNPNNKDYVFSDGSEATVRTKYNHKEPEKPLHFEGWFSDKGFETLVPYQPKDTFHQKKRADYGEVLAEKYKKQQKAANQQNSL